MKDDRTFVFETADGFSYGLLKQYAKENRLFMTEAEHVLWNMMRDKMLGYKFRRQHIIGNYIADFVDLHHKLIVEIDGKYHFVGDMPVSDAVRTADLNKMGFTVIRFKNEEVLATPQNVLNRIKQKMKEMEASSKPSKKASPQPSPIGEGETYHGNTNSCGTLNSFAPNSFEVSQSGGTQKSLESPKSGGTYNASPSPIGEGRGGASSGAPVGIPAWAVDAGCSGNPGPMEYQGVDLVTGKQVFHFGPYYADGSIVYGTNNIGEFLAIVHALALMDKTGITDKAIYSDSYNAILWVRKKQCKTKLERTERTEPLYALISRAEKWLRSHNVTTPIIQWQTRQWGDIPADFGRK